VLILKGKYQIIQGDRFYNRTYNVHPIKAWGTLSGIMPYIPARRIGNHGLESYIVWLQLRTREETCISCRPRDGDRDIMIFLINILRMFYV